MPVSLRNQRIGLPTTSRWGKAKQNNSNANILRFGDSLAQVFISAEKVGGLHCPLSAQSDQVPHDARIHALLLSARKTAESDLHLRQRRKLLVIG